MDYEDRNREIEEKPKTDADDNVMDIDKIHTYVHQLIRLKVKEDIIKEKYEKDMNRIQDERQWIYERLSDGFLRVYFPDDTYYDAFNSMENRKKINDARAVKEQIPIVATTQKSVLLHYIPAVIFEKEKISMEKILNKISAMQ